MNRRNILGLVAACAIAAGCATSGQIQTAYQPTPGEKFSYRIVPPADMSEEARTILRERLNAQLTSAGQLAANGDAAANPVDVTITNYRMRHGATRALVGIFAGTDSIESTVEVKDAKTGAIKGKFNVSSGNASAWGTSRGLIEDHADQIVQYLKTGGSK